MIAAMLIAEGSVKAVESDTVQLFLSVMFTLYAPAPKLAASELVETTVAGTQVKV